MNPLGNILFLLIQAVHHRNYLWDCGIMYFAGNLLLAIIVSIVIATVAGWIVSYLSTNLLVSQMEQHNRFDIFNDVEESDNDDSSDNSDDSDSEYSDDDSDYSDDDSDYSDDDSEELDDLKINKKIFIENIGKKYNDFNNKFDHSSDDDTDEDTDDE